MQNQPVQDLPGRRFHIASSISGKQQQIHCLLHRNPLSLHLDCFDRHGLKIPCRLARDACPCCGSFPAEMLPGLRRPTTFRSSGYALPPEGGVCLPATLHLTATFFHPSVSTFRVALLFPAVFPFLCTCHRSELF